MQESDQRLIESCIVSLPGCRDRSNSPLIFINFIDTNNSQTGKNKPLVENGKFIETVINPNYHKLVSVISYLAQIPEQNAGKLSFTVIIDGRKAIIKHLRCALRACQQALYQRIQLVLVVQPEKFLDQQKLNFELIKEAYQFKCTLITIHKLSRFVDVNQLPDTLGGTLHYDPHAWSLLRQKYENYVKRANTWIESNGKCDSSIHATSVQSNKNTFEKNKMNSTDFLKNGQELFDELLQNAKSGQNQNFVNLDWITASQHIKVLMKQIKAILFTFNHKSTEEVPAEKSRQQERSISLKLLEEHAEGMHNLVYWILNAGEKWLLTLHEIGESFDDANQLLKEHNELGSKLKEVEEQSRDLIAIGRVLQYELPEHATKTQQSIDKLQQVMRAFSSRVTRQKFSRKTDLLLESLCTNVKATDIASATKEQHEMEAKVDDMEKTYHNVITNGVAFIDELCIDESNSMGRPITRDYSAGIVHIRERLEEIRDRRRRCQNLSDFRRLKIQQLLQLFTCERDAEQAVLWIEELYEALISECNEIEFDVKQRRILRENRLKLEKTALSTYEYGKELCQVAFVLRRSLRMEVQPEFKLNQRLHATWRKFCYAFNEKETKIDCSDTFYSTIQKVSKRLDELSLRLDDKSLEKRLKENTLKWFNEERKHITNDIQELKHIADILLQGMNNNTLR
ncbi:unnamed protein product [Thelazia callipaeda]|uniref:CRAL-TRIO domain-containing protein n=1 Tax=Thelazia callipaeda TaxID=103827 RepID=A0A158RB84_THECL|nr:unnamed protein product [Thelazia callipaeda]